MAALVPAFDQNAANPFSQPLAIPLAIPLRNLGFCNENRLIFANLETESALDTACLYPSVIIGWHTTP